MKKTLCLLIFLSSNAYGQFDSDFEKFAVGQIIEVVSDGVKNIGLGNWGAKGIALYATDLGSKKQDSLTPSDIYKSLKCEHVAGYEITSEKYDIEPIAVALCKNDNPLLQPFLLKEIPSLPPALYYPGLEKLSTFPSKHIAADNAYLFPVVLFGHGVFVVPTIVMLSPNTQYVSVVQLMPKQWVCKNDSNVNARLCDDVQGLLIEIAAKILQYQ